MDRRKRLYWSLALCGLAGCTTTGAVTDTPENFRLPRPPL